MKEDISDMQLKFMKIINNIEKLSRLKLYTTNQAAHKSDRYSVDEQPTNVDDAADFLDYLYEELELCGLHMTGWFGEIQCDV